jgi:hypothetical protein
MVQGVLSMKFLLRLQLTLLIGTAFSGFSFYGGVVGVDAFVVPSYTSKSSTCNDDNNVRKASVLAAKIKVRNGLQYEDVEIGTGRRVLPGDAVLCYYVGTFPGQSQAFDETEPGEPAEFVVGKGKVIPGWDLGIVGNLALDLPPMNIGGDRKLVVPSGLAYGSEGAGPIPPDQDLEFQIMILNAQRSSGVADDVQRKGFAGLFGFLSLFAILAVIIAQNYQSWF